MANVRYEQRWCPADERLVRAEQTKPNHILHLLLAIITAGLWIPVWLLITASHNWSGYRCPACGGKTENKDWHAIKADIARRRAEPKGPSFWQQVRERKEANAAAKRARADARAAARDERAAARRAKQARW